MIRYALRLAAELAIVVAAFGSLAFFIIVMAALAYPA